MTGVILKDTLRANWKQTIYWGFGIGLLGFYFVALASSSDIMASYGPLLESLPPEMLNMMGISDALMFTTQEGMISGGYVAYSMLMLSAYALITGLHVTINEEDNGIMDVLLALPITRTQVIIEKSIAVVLLAFGVIVLCIIYPLIGIVIFNVEVDKVKVIVSILTVYPGILVIMGVTSLIGTIVRRRSTTIGLSIGFILVSYFLNFLGNAASETFAPTLQQLSFFYYTNGEAVVLNTFNPLTSIILIVVAVICFGIMIITFNRRDIGL
jgi:ABC-2 type transport system permease protein